MTRTPNIAVISIGYGHDFAFEDPNHALELMALMSKAVAVDSSAYGLGEQPHSHFLSEDAAMPKLEFVAAHKFNPHETVKEAKARLERERQDRADVDQQFREAPPALPSPAPAVSPADDEVIF